MMIMGGEIEVVMMETRRGIYEFVVVDMDIGIKIHANFPPEIQEKLLVVMVEADIGPRTATISPITQVTMVDCCVYLRIKEEIIGVMVQDVDAGLNR